jgi:outer membrane receptor protein involved in Fe transport
VIVLDGERIDNASGQRLDDLLRSIPGFSLFRRQPSLIAHPTTQGATLRGIGATGASRALVLVDGIPIQDPFGGWVYWGRIPRELIERIEVVRGGGSSLWGNAAMSGVINVITKPPDDDREVLRAEKGNRDTTNVETLASHAWTDAGVRADAAYLDSGGTYLVAGGDRVPFDTRADSREVTLGLRTDWRLSPRWLASLDGRYFDEKRDNGTELGDNETDNFAAHAGIEGESVGGSGFRADVYGQVQEFKSRFSSQDRTAGIELPSLDQFDVPSGSLGFGARAWTRPLARHIALVGVDYAFVDGHTNENFRYIDGTFTRRRKAGGREHVVGAYVQDIWRPLERLEVTTGLRADYWRSEDGERRETDLADGATLMDQSLPAKDEVFLSPRVGALLQLAPALALRASAYRGFRAPTLNELYRPFRVRNDITEANADLDLERLTGAEIGFDARSGPGTLAATAYWNRIDDPIVNVTVADGPGDVPPCGFVPDGGVCRQRQNLGETRTLGLELDATFDVTSRLRLRGGYLLSEAEIRSAGSAVALDGNDIPQVPEHQAVMGADWHPRDRIGVFLETRFVGDQFDDDENERELEAYVVIDAAISLALDDHWELFVRGENVLGERYEVAKTADGLTTYAPAAMVHGGVRWRSSR